jgi:hypothetical protein
MNNVKQQSRKIGAPLVDSWIDVRAHLRPPESEADRTSIQMQMQMLVRSFSPILSSNGTTSVFAAVRRMLRIRDRGALMQE